MPNLPSWRLCLPIASVLPHRHSVVCYSSSDTTLHSYRRVMRSSALHSASAISSWPVRWYSTSTLLNVAASHRAGLLYSSRAYTFRAGHSSTPIAARSLFSPICASAFVCQAHRCATHQTRVSLELSHQSSGVSSTDATSGLQGKPADTGVGSSDNDAVHTADASKGHSTRAQTANSAKNDRNASSGGTRSSNTSSPASPASPFASVKTLRAGSIKDAPLSIPMWRVIKMVWNYLWPETNSRIRLLVVSSVVCVFAAKVLKVVVPFWFKSIVDSLACGGLVASKVGLSSSVATTAAATTAAAVNPFALGVFGCVVAYGVCRISATIAEEAKTILFAPVGGHASSALAMEMFNKLLKLDLRFHLNRETGAVSKDLDRGSRAFWTLAYTLLFLIVPTIFEMGLVCVALNSQAGPQFLVIAAVSVVSYIGWTYTITNWRAKFRARYNALDSRLGGLIVDALMNFETIKYFCTEAYESARIHKEVTKLNKELIKLDQSIAVLNVGQQLIFVAAGVLSLHLATCGVLSGAMTVGDLVLVDALVMQLYMPLSYLGMIYRDVQSSTQNMQSMIALLDQQPAVTEAVHARPYVYKNGTIELRNVCFSYRLDPASEAAAAAAEEEEDVKHNSNADKSISNSQISTNNNNNNNNNTSDTDTRANGDEDAERDGETSSFADAEGLLYRHVLRNLTLTIPGGSTVAFVGPSGSGKSTIFRLLYRFYNTTGGSILLDGQPISQLQISSVRQAISVIPQDSVLFNDSVRYNIRYGCREASDAEVEQAARRASVHQAICRMSAGYDTVVGERGLKLSGGEKQRVAIARALLEDAPILLADEATSALDSNAEHVVMHTLKTYTTRSSARTIVLIAHRLTTVREADIIFVLNGHGGLAEQGTHDELLRHGGLYALMWNQQLREKNRKA